MLAATVPFAWPAPAERSAWPASHNAIGRYKMKGNERHVRNAAVATYSKAALTNWACWATSPPILADSARYWLSGPAIISSKPATLMLLLLLGAAVAVATDAGWLGKVGVVGAGGAGAGSDFVFSSAGCGAISVCSRRSTSVSRRSQILSKCSTAAVGFDSDSLLSVKAARDQS